MMEKVKIKKIAYFSYLLMFCICACTSTFKIKDGQQAYDLKKYSKAIDLLKKEIEKSTKREEKAQKSFLLANSFEKLSILNRALEWYTYAEKSDYGINATLKKAYCLKKMMRYNEAADVFTTLQNITSLSAEVKQQAILCKGLILERNSVFNNEVVDKFLSESFYSDYSAVHYDDDYLVITSDREEATGASKYDWTGNRYSDLFILDKDTKNIRKFDTAINSEHNEGTPAFTKDYLKMVFTRCFDEAPNQNDNCKLYFSTRVDGLWLEPKILPFVKTGFNYGQPTFFENDSVLIFSAKLTGEDHYDLYYCEFDGQNFSEPDKMPKTINTSYNEHFPSSDGDTLYFSSDNIVGMGGLDIYKTWIEENGTWKHPFRLRFPINSGADDFSYIIDRGGVRNTQAILSKAYFTSSRANDGRDAIYEYKLLKDRKTSEENPEVDKKIEKKIEVYLALKIVTPKYLENNPLKEKIGKLNLSAANISILSSGKIVLEGNSDKNGLLLTQLDEGNDYVITVMKDSFLSNQINLSTKDIIIKENETSITINKEVELIKINRGQEFLLENIYYEYDKWDITGEAKPSLDNLVKILINNPKISIELGSHTDCRGTDEYNISLSQKRAESAVNYLLERGISSSRISPKGYGESIPTISCECEACSEREHKINRRTSFKIL